MDRDEVISQQLLDAVLAHNFDAASKILHAFGDSLEECLRRTAMLSVEYADQRGSTPLHVALRMGDLRISKLLVESGAPLNQKDGYGETPLALSLKFAPELFVLMLQQRTSKNLSAIDSKGQNLLHHIVAARSERGIRGADFRRVPIMMMLIEQYGLNPFQRDNTGETPYARYCCSDCFDFECLALSQIHRRNGIGEGLEFASFMVQP